jgi:hypothetical protein
MYREKMFPYNNKVFEIKHVYKVINMHNNDF